MNLNVSASTTKINIGFKCLKKDLDQVIVLLAEEIRNPLFDQKEFEKLQDRTLSPAQLLKIKSQLKGQMAMAEESNLNFMLMMAKSLLDREKIETLEEIFEQIDLVSADKMQQMAREMLNPADLSVLIFEP